jgi:uncharacterized protein (DUF1810 family)
MTDVEYDLNRFVRAQEKTYATALAEVQAGKRRGHWMAFIFPMFTGLGVTDKARLYAIRSLPEARNYLDHPVLGPRLSEITEALLDLESSDARAVLGEPADVSLHASMTLFTLVDPAPYGIFREVLDKFFKGEVDSRTLGLLQQHG